MTARRRVALVTGAARGIGRALVDSLVAQGFDVAATRHASSSIDRIDRIDPEPAATARVRFYATDLSDPTSIDELLGRVLADHDRVDVLVSNAAQLRDGLVSRMSDADFQSVLGVNLLAPQRLSAALLPAMRAAGWGRIVFVSSVGGLLGSAGQANYASSKGALTGLAGGLAVEAAADGVTVNVVAPGPVDTELLRALPGDRYDALREMVPTGRLGRPDEVAAAILFLCSDEASFVNGVTLPVDGGLMRADTWSRTPKKRR